MKKKRLRKKTKSFKFSQNNHNIRIILLAAILLLILFTVYNLTIFVKKGVVRHVTYNLQPENTNYVKTTEKIPVYQKFNTIQTASTTTNTQYHAGFEPSDDNEYQSKSMDVNDANRTNYPAKYSVDTSYLPPAKNQGVANSCTAWTAAYYMMGWFANKYSWSMKNDSFAPLYLYNYIDHGKNGGTNLEQIESAVKSIGADNRTHYADSNTLYGDSDYTHTPTAEEIVNGKSNMQTYFPSGFDVHSIVVSKADDAIVKNTIRNAFMKYQTPLALAIQFTDALIDARSNNYVIYDDLPSNDALQNHMVTAYGYDDTGVYVRNSWGTGWGNNGDGILTWHWLKNHMYKHFYTFVPSDSQYYPVATNLSVDIPTDSQSEEYTWTASNHASYYFLNITPHNENRWFATRASADDTSLVINNLSPNTLYDAVLIPCNNYGCGEASDLFTIATLASDPSTHSSTSENQSQNVDASCDPGTTNRFPVYGDKCNPNDTSGKSYYHYCPGNQTAVTGVCGVGYTCKVESDRNDPNTHDDCVPVQ